ncbi:hypothetical protein M1466_03625 [Candidatus Dependentiae bacterium]|nr:hypothetical protein [Candidatus Dependentiae bacterium]
MNNHQAFLSLILTAIALVTMPSYTHYKARKKNAAITATNTIRQQNNQQAEEVPEDSIAISYHILSKRECQQCFDNTNVIAKGLQPVYLTIVNNTKRTFTATGANSTIPYATAGSYRTIAYVIC